jgi:hypothetical protein
MIPNEQRSDSTKELETCTRMPLFDDKNMEIIKEKSEMPIHCIKRTETDTSMAIVSELFHSKL